MSTNRTICVCLWCQISLLDKGGPPGDLPYKGGPRGDLACEWR